MKEVMEIRSQIGQIRKKLQDARARLADAALREIGLQIGDRIIVDRRGVDVECSVSGVEVSEYNGDPKPLAVIVKKDGTSGVQSVGYFRGWRKKGGK